ncbi:MAG: tetratricopeptide repeat protein, partial [Saprospiraceae bacterium]
MSVVYGNACFNHGRILYGKKELEQSEKWYNKSIEIREKLLGKENLDYAWSLNNLAILYVDIGKFDKAESFYLQA